MLFIIPQWSKSCWADICFVRPIQYLLYCLQRRRADSDTKPAVRHVCSQPPPAETVEHFLTVRRQFYFHVFPLGMKNTWFLHHLPLTPVSSDNRGQGSRSACPSIGTHMGVTNSPGLCLPFFFFFFFPLHLQSELTWHSMTENKEFLSVTNRFDIIQSNKENSWLSLELQRDHDGDRTHAGMTC